MTAGNPALSVPDGAGHSFGQPALLAAARMGRRAMFPLPEPCVLAAFGFLRCRATRPRRARRRAL
eukprot:1669726-Lingulodinium_polyedra.AAC.1